MRSRSNGTTRSAEKRSSDAMMDEYRRLADQPALPARKEGDAGKALGGAARKVSASFEFPYLAHAPMEPLDAVVKLDAKSCEIWAGDQFQTIDQMNAAQAAGLDPQQVSIHTLYAGGSFGRRANTGSDYIVEAVSIAKAYGADGTPIKLQWTREDDIHGGLYRPMYFHKLEAGLNAQDELTAWRHVIVGQSIMAGTMFAAGSRMASMPPRSKARRISPTPFPTSRSIWRPPRPACRCCGGAWSAARIRPLRSRRSSTRWRTPRARIRSRSAASCSSTSRA